MTMASILDLASVISARTSIEEQIEWFQSEGLLARVKNCPSCNHAMEIKKRNDVTDKYTGKLNNVQLCFSQVTLLL